MQVISEGDDEGELIINLPDNLDAGSYKLVIVNERIGKACQTNYEAWSQITLNIT